ncbi:MAG: phosphoenolpyruvate kinase, partial [Thermoanaerobaculia bacterium]
MKTTLTPELTRNLLAPLARANADFAAAFPGEPSARQPVHTVYGGAHLFRSDSAGKLGTLAQAAFRDSAPDFVTFARALGLRGAETLADTPDAIAQLAE